MLVLHIVPVLGRVSPKFHPQAPPMWEIAPGPPLVHSPAFWDTHFGPTLIANSADCQEMFDEGFSSLVHYICRSSQIRVIRFSCRLVCPVVRVHLSAAVAALVAAVAVSMCRAVSLCFVSMSRADCLPCRVQWCAAAHAHLVMHIPVRFSSSLRSVNKVVVLQLVQHVHHEKTLLVLCFSTWKTKCEGCLAG